MDISAAEITSEMLPMDEGPEGYFAYDTDEEDRAAEAEIYAQLSRGNGAAWCGFVVTATLGEFKGRAGVWGCSYGSEAEIKIDLLADSAKEARDNLRASVNRTIAQLAEIGAI